MFTKSIALSEAKTNTIRSTKRTYYKEWSFASNCFSLWTSYKELIWCTSYPNDNIDTFRMHWILFRVLFPWSILNSLNLFPHKTSFPKCIRNVLWKDDVTMYSEPSRKGFLMLCFSWTNRFAVALMAKLSYLIELAAKMVCVHKECK